MRHRLVTINHLLVFEEMICAPACTVLCDYLCILFALGRVTKYCDEYVCLSVCLTVSALMYLENHTAELHQLFCVLPLVVAQCSSGDVSTGYVLPVSWMALCFHIVGSMALSAMQEVIPCESNATVVLHCCSGDR